MKCPQCGAEAQKGDKFCLQCGASLTQKAESDNSGLKHSPAAQNHNQSAPLPAEQAEKFFQNAHQAVKHLTNEELVMGGGALLSLIGFFLPWYGGIAETRNAWSIAAYSNRLYFILLFAIASLLTLYFSQGTKHSTKVFLTTLQAVAGMYILAMGLTSANSTSLLGVWLTVIGGALLTGFSLYFQSKVLLKG